MNDWYKRNAPKPELTYDKAIVIVRNTIVLLLVPPTVKDPHYQWMNLSTGRLNSGDGWATPEEAIKSYHDGDKAFNVDLDKLIREITPKQSISY